MTHLRADEADARQGMEAEDGNPGISFFSPSFPSLPSSSPQATPLGNLRLVRQQRAAFRASASRVLAKYADEVGLPRPRICGCGWAPTGAQVAVTVGPSGAARYAGLQHCGSVWLCAPCSARIRAGRAAELEDAARRWTADGGHLALLTLTVSHTASDLLVTLLEAVSTGWSKMISGAGWCGGKRTVGIRNEYGIAGFVRALEITNGRNGWHVHVHALLFLEQPLDSAQHDELHDELYERWARIVTKLGAGTPSRERGVDLRAVHDDGTVLATYLNKLDAHVSIGLEVARSDVKRGRKQGRYTPWELAHAGDEGDERARERFIEYAEATRGRKVLTWSRNLRHRLGLDAEVDDEQLLDDIEEAEEVGFEPVLMMSADEWRALRRVEGAPSLLLEWIEEQRQESAQTLVRAAVLIRGRLFEDDDGPPV